MGNYTFANTITGGKIWVIILPTQSISLQQETIHKRQTIEKAWTIYNRKSRKEMMMLMWFVKVNLPYNSDKKKKKKISNTGGKAKIDIPP